MPWLAIRLPTTAPAQAWRFALDPTPVQTRCMARHVGAARFAYNWGLALALSRLDERTRLREEALTEAMSQREADAAAATIEVPGDLYDLRREWNAAKATVAPWWPANSKEAYSSGLDGLAPRPAGLLRLGVGQAGGSQGGVAPEKEASLPGAPAASPPAASGSSTPTTSACPASGWCGPMSAAPSS